MIRNVDKYEKAKAVRVLKPYVIEVTFADGTVREVDLERELYGEVFEPLKDFAFSSRASVDPVLGVVLWPNGADFAPEFMYQAGKAKASAS